MSDHEVEFSGYEFAAGVATGQRAFNVDPLGRLTGVYYEAIWTPGENTYVCLLGRKHALPEAGPDGVTRTENTAYSRFDKCSCGFYAYHDGSEHYAGTVQGVIEAYGKVTIGTKGFRAEKARIVALALPGVEPEESSTKKTWRQRWDAYCAKVDLADHFWPAYISACVGVISLSVAIPMLFDLWWLGTLLLLLAGVAGTTVAAGVRGEQVTPYNPFARELARHRISPEQAALIRRNYPDVKFYATREAMLKAHPVDPQLAPGPDSPGFWDDDYTTKSNEPSAPQTAPAASTGFLLT